MLEFFGSPECILCSTATKVISNARFLHTLYACHAYMEQLATTSVHFRSCTELTLPSVILQLWLFLITHTVNTSAFYSFGVSTGDTQLPRVNDNSSVPINLPVPIPFFGRLERRLYVSQLLVLCI